MRSWGRDSLWLLLLPLAFLSTPKTAAASHSATHTSANTSSFSHEFSNSTRLGAIDPSQFVTRTHYRGYALPLYALLMNAVDAMVQLALLDWEGSMGAKRFRLAVQGYAPIEILIDTADPEHPSETMHPAYAVLGLYEVMRGILEENDYYCLESQSELMYEGRAVGSLIVRAVGFNNNSPSAASDNGKEILPPTPSVSSLSTPAWQDPRLKVNIIHGRNILTFYEVFFTVLAMLRQAAVHPRTGQVVEISVVINRPPITTEGAPILVAFSGVGRPRANPPYFEYEWLIKALGQLPLYMLNARIFKVVSLVRLTVDGVVVGQGRVVRERRGLDDS